jgi:hypothetical protein
MGQGPDCAEANQGGQVGMGKLLIWFGILYGNLCALVGLAVVIVWWTKQPGGQQFCESVGLGLSACRSGLMVVDILVIGTATLMSFRRLAAVRRQFDKTRD